MSGKKRKALVDDSSEIEFVGQSKSSSPPKRAAVSKAFSKSSASKKPTVKKSGKKAADDDVFVVDDDDEEDYEDQNGYEEEEEDDVKPSKPPPKKKAKVEENDDSEPTGKPNCLSGLTFLFTGDLDNFDRDDSNALVKKYGGKVVTAVSNKVTHGVVGSGAGKAKLKQLNALDDVKIMDKAGFFELVRTLPAGKSAKAKGKAKAKLEDDDDEEEEEKEKPKQKWTGPPQRNGPSAPGSKEIPEGEPNCLMGLTFVFTGELDSLDRDDATNLAKRFGGRVTSAPSSKTSYVVIGSNAGQSKLDKLKKLPMVKQIDEDGFLDLIRTRKAGDVDEKTIKKQKEDEKKIIKAAEEMGPISQESTDSKAQLWTVRYAPKTIKDICGNKSNVEKIMNWLQQWDNNVAANFKKPGKDMLGTHRALLISGSPGIGKTTAAHLAARLSGYTVIELNASDTRSKKLLELGFKSAIDNTSLDGFFGTGSKKQFEGQPDAGQKAVIIMDEVDGMSGGDRGGVGAVNALIKKTKIPIICIANDKSLPKMKPLVATTGSIVFKKPSAAEVRSRLMSIAHREKIKIAGNIIDQLVAGAQSDIRQIVNMMSTYALTATSAMDFDTGKALAESSEKNAIMTPFTLIEKLFNPYMFSHTAKTTLTDKLELYFHDFAMMPLFVQENYAKFKFTRAANLSARDQAAKNIELVQKAADAISEGDLMDSLIHGSQQHWSLLPAHGIQSTVRPASFCYGAGSYGGAGDWGGSKSTRAFPAWFGKNSTQTRLRNALGEVQIRMRLRVSGDRKEIRQSYLPLLAPRLAEPIASSGNDGIADTIELMDDYFLTKDEFDSIMELGLEDLNGEVLMKGVAPATKAAFTRKFNTTSHPIPFHKAADLGKAPKKMAKGAAPDLEDLIELDEEIPEEEAVEEEEDDEAKATKDKLVKSKKKPAAKAKDGAEKKKRAPAKKKAKD